MIEYSQNLISEFENIAIRAAILGGKEIMHVYKSDNFDVWYKEDVSPLTVADINSHNAIAEALASTGISVLSEEGDNIPFEVRRLWNRLWVVDPLDGTKEFVARNGEFAVNIALVEGQHPSLGVILHPVAGKLYVGGLNFGLKVFQLCDNWEREDIEVVISQLELEDVSMCDLPNVFTVVASKSHFDKATQQLIDNMKDVFGDVGMVHIGSALKQCLVAVRQAHFYPRTGPTMEWDTAAGQALVQAVGGNILAYPSLDELTYNRPCLTNPSFICFNGSKEASSFVDYLLHRNQM